jgi:molybdopterin-binding protein
LRTCVYGVGVAASYRPGQIAELLGVSVDTVRRLVDSGKLAVERTEAGQRVVSGVELARFLTEQHHRPDPEPIVGQSARNRFTGIVTRVVRDTVAAQVELQAGPHRIVSLMTREAADELGLEPGVLAVASIKSTNVVVEVPEAR